MHTLPPILADATPDLIQLIAAIVGAILAYLGGRHGAKSQK